MVFRRNKSIPLRGPVLGVLFFGLAGVAVWGGYSAGRERLREEHKDSGKRILGRWKCADPNLAFFIVFHGDGQATCYKDGYGVSGRYCFSNGEMLETQTTNPISPPPKGIPVDKIHAKYQFQVRWENDCLLLESVDESLTRCFERAD